MKTRDSRPRRATSELRLRRYRLGLGAEAVARETGFSVWRVFRIERAPARARLGDVLLLDQTLQRLERATDVSPDFRSALSSALGKRSEPFTFGRMRGGR
jgi:hypothetical protein